MSASGAISRLSKERAGLTMIAASLLGIAVLSLIIVNYQNGSRLSDIRTEGVSLVRLLSRLSYDDLVEPERNANVLEALVYASSNDTDGLLYAAVTDATGVVQQQASQSGVFAPPGDGARLGAVSGEARLAIPGSGMNVLEFYSPLMRAGEPAGFVRVGYEVPRGVAAGQLPFYATLALIVFGLTTLIYFLFRREIQPIRKLQNAISDVVDSGSLQAVSVSASGELAEFMQRFDDFVGLAQNRIKHLEVQETKLLSDKKLINFRRSRVERVLESLPFGVLVMDEVGAVTFVNNMTATLLGVQREQLRDADCSDWSPAPELTEMLAEVRQRCRGSFAIDPIEIEPLEAKERTVEVSARQMLDGGGAVVVVDDVTPEVLARRSRGEFVAHVAHELKTPLNTLAMYSEALQGEEAEDRGFRLEAANIISDEVERLADLISNLLSIARIEDGSLSLSGSLVKPRSLLVDAFEAAKRSGNNSQLRFELKLPSELSPISADKDLLRVALNNLLSNAIKYNRPDGTVTLAAEEDDESLVIEVSDTGIGIDEADQQRIFDKFFRSESDDVRARPGHGLGLALAGDIVRLHSGVLELESVPKEGTTFRLVLWKDLSSVRRAI